MVSRQRRWQIERARAGLCVICGKAGGGKGERCPRHYRRHLEDVRRHYAKRVGRVITKEVWADEQALFGV